MATARSAALHALINLEQGRSDRVRDGLDAARLVGREHAFAGAWPRIQKAVRDYAPPFVAAIDGSGRIKLLTSAVRRAERKKSR